MVQVNEKTPVQSRLNCNEPACNKTFKTQVNKEKQTSKFHSIVNALSNTPFATSVRTLFQGDSIEDINSPSIQGNSAGQVNVREEVSEADFLCGQCDKRFDTNTQASNHMKDKHDKTHVVATNNVSADTETTHNVSNSDNVSNLWVEPSEIIDNVTLAEELERIAKIVETVAISG